jgi:hypothetical protein
MDPICTAVNPSWARKSKCDDVLCHGATSPLLSIHSSLPYGIPLDAYKELRTSFLLPTSSSSNASILISVPLHNLNSLHPNTLYFTSIHPKQPPSCLASSTRSRMPSAPTSTTTPPPPMALIEPITLMAPTVVSAVYLVQSSSDANLTIATGITGTSTNYGPHDSILANKADPRVDSDLGVSHLSPSSWTVI